MTKTIAAKKTRGTLGAAKKTGHLQLLPPASSQQENLEYAREHLRRALADLAMFTTIVAHSSVTTEEMACVRDRVARALFCLDGAL